MIISYICTDMVSENKYEPVFRFKQFDIVNCKSAMKVGTDAVLLGAWSSLEGVRHVWDVGCGTGVLTLMTAQRSQAKITAIEIDADAASETQTNASASRWAERIDVRCGDIMSIYKSIPEPDLIISNPPYFSNNRHGLHSPDKARSAARHEGSLTYSSLIAISAESLSKNGRLCFISPSDRRDDVEYAIISARMSVNRITEIYPSPNKAVKRILWEVSRNNNNYTCNKLYICDANGDYSDEYRSLTSDFYLKF